MRFLRKITANGRRPAWALTLDVASFFPSIHKATLFEIIRRRIKDPELRWLTRTILFHDPTTHYRFRSLDRHAAKPELPGISFRHKRACSEKAQPLFQALTTILVSGPS